MEFIKEYECLPEGIHLMTWKDAHEFFNFSKKREQLLAGMERMMEILKACGCDHLYLDGSFVTNELNPNDIDAFFSIAYGENITNVYRRLVDKEPFLFPNPENRKCLKQKYGCEVFWKYAAADTDMNGNEIPYIEYFQQLKEYPDIKKGIVKIKLLSYDKKQEATYAK